MRSPCAGKFRDVNYEMIWNKVTVSEFSIFFEKGPKSEKFGLFWLKKERYMGSNFDPKVEFYGLFLFCDPKMNSIFGIAWKFYVD